MTKGMLKVSVFYPNAEGKNFNMNYYSNVHLPMVGELLGASLKSASVDGGLAGAEPGSTAPFLAMGHMYFDSLEDFQQSFGPHAEQIMGDVPNYTNTEPIIQISEVMA